MPLQTIDHYINYVCENEKDDCQAKSTGNEYKDAELCGYWLEKFGSLMKDILIEAKSFKILKEFDILQGS